jgi:hypothetical protein
VARCSWWCWRQPVGDPCGSERLSTAGEPLADSEAQTRITALQQQLEAKNDYLHATFEELEAANERIAILERGDAVGERGAAVHERGAGDLGRSCSR